MRESRSGGDEPVWMDRVLVDAIHADLLASYGGLPGVRDENALESALARPRNRFHYEPDAVSLILDVATRRISEVQLAAWLREHTVPFSQR